MSIVDRHDGSRSALPGRYRIFETGLDSLAVSDLKNVIAKTLGRRSPLGGEQRDHKWWINLDVLLASHGEKPVRQILMLLAHSSMVSWCRQQMGDDLVAVMNYCIFRRFDPARNPVPAQWHFDANIFGLDTPIVNFWIALDDVGETAPGLTLVDTARRPSALWSRMIELAAASDGVFDRTNRPATLFSDADVAAAMAADPDVRFITPKVNAGAAIAFDHQFLHGTQAYHPGMGVRDSFEFRVMPTDAAMAAGFDRQYQLVRIPKV